MLRVNPENRFKLYSFSITIIYECLLGKLILLVSIWYRFEKQDKNYRLDFGHPKLTVSDINSTYSIIITGLKQYIGSFLQSKIYWILFSDFDYALLFSILFTGKHSYLWDKTPSHWDKCQRLSAQELIFYTNIFFKI